MKRHIAKTFIGLAALAATIAPAAAQSDWQRQVARLVASKQTYPRAAQMRGDEGTAKIKIYVGADGSIERTELVAPSGSSLLDREAVGIPAKTGKLPAPPGGATVLVVPLVWKLL